MTLSHNFRGKSVVRVLYVWKYYIMIVSLNVERGELGGRLKLSVHSGPMVFEYFQIGRLIVHPFQGQDMVLNKRRFRICRFGCFIRELKKTFRWCKVPTEESFQWLFIFVCLRIVFSVGIPPVFQSFYTFRFLPKLIEVFRRWTSQNKRDPTRTKFKLDAEKITTRHLDTVNNVRKMVPRRNL